MVDLKRERELAEKRKNDPPLDLSSDHPVRKLISKFRKISDAKALQNGSGTGEGSTSDLERGNSLPNNSSDVTVNIEHNQVPAKLSNVSENAKPEKQMTSKWGRFLATASGGGAGGTSNDDKNDDKPIEMKTLETPSSSSSLSAAPPPVRIANKPASKWSRMLNTRQETIEEAGEEEEGKSNLHKTDSTDSGILRSNQKLDQSEDSYQPSGGAGGDPSKKQTDPKLSGVDKDFVLTSLYDIKLEIKEEIGLLNHKMNRIDEQIGDILRLFSPGTSPYCTHMQSSPSSRGCSTSRSSSESNSNVTSPKNSLPPSPHRAGIAPIVTADPSRKSGSAGSSFRHDRPQSPPSNSSSGRTTPSSSEQPANGAGGSGAKLRTKIIKGRSRSRQIQPQEDPVPEDENMHIKDRDLDIL